jgi:tripartite ATP-independent transporter DctP family solute receptor
MTTKMFKKGLVFITFLAMVAVFVGCGANNTNSEETNNTKPEYVFKMATVLAEKDVTGYGINKFAELVSEKSDGNIEIEVFHGGQLGSGAETFEAVKNGNIDIASDSFANLAGITPAFEIFHLPFLFESRQQALTAFSSEKIHERVDQELSEVGIKWFSSFEIGGPREIGTSNKKINSIEDLNGLKFRASRSPLEIASIEAWGAKGVTVDWPETPESVRLGMVDGLTVPYASFYSAKFHEGALIKYMADVNFQWYSLVTVVNDEKWEALPEDVKEILTEASREAEAWHVDFVSDYITENVSEMKAEGVEVYSLSDDAYNEIKEVTKEKVWGEFVGTSQIPQDKLDLILEERGPVGEGGWGYKITE